MRTIDEARSLIADRDLVGTQWARNGEVRTFVGYGCVPDRLTRGGKLVDRGYTIYWWKNQNGDSGSLEDPGTLLEWISGATEIEA